jgi:Ca2+-binding RTX toxin-like protein
MVSYTLEIVAGPTGSQATGPNADFGVVFDENIQDDVLIGTIAEIDPAVQSIVWRDTVNNENRFYNITKNAAGVWEIRVKAGQGGITNFSWETTAQRAQDIHFDAYSGPNGTGTKLGEGDFTITLNDVNEAPRDIVFVGAPTTNPKVGVTHTGAQIVDANATDPDSIAKPQWRTNNFKFGAGTASAADATIDVTGLYKIDPTSGIVTTIREMTADDAGNRTLKIVVYDTTTPGVAFEEDYAFTVDPATTANAPPTVGNLSAAGAGTLVAGNIQVNENAGAVQIFDVNGTDTDGNIVGYTLTGTNLPAGAFSVDANGTVSVNTAALGNITQDTTYTVRVTATDNEGATGFRDVNVVVKEVTPPQNQKPTIDVNGGTQIIGATANGPSVKAFYDIEVDDDEDDALTMTISFASGDGELRDQNNQPIAVKTDDGTTKTYEFTGTKGVLNAILDELRFDARDRNDGGIIDTNFTVKVWDIDHQGAPAQNNQITVSTALMNRAPTIQLDGSKTFRVNDINDAVYAFGGFDLFDIERDQLTMTIKFNEDHGDLAVANLPDFERIAGQKVYTFANRTAGELEVILDNLRFNATDRPNQNSGTVETTFTVEVSDGGNTATNTELKVITDIVNKQPPTQNQAPKDLALTIPSNIVNEYTAVNLEIGTLSATDGNGDVLTYKLLDNAGGRFAIANNKLVLAGAGVNFEEAKSHQIKVEVSDGKGGRAEQVFTINVGDQLTVNKRGTKKADKLNGSLQDDILKGGTGTVKDTIKGLAGDDQLYGENGNDSVLGGDGIDRLYGGNGDDILKGDAGNDTLFGEAGNDKLYGGVGSDTFVFNKKPAKTSNFDRIYDFKSVEGDKIFLDNAVFKKLGKLGTFDAPAKLDVSMFKAGKAKDKNDYLVYKSGVLYYDADGSGKGAAVEIVKVGGLKATDIWVI